MSDVIEPDGGGSNTDTDIDSDSSTVPVPGPVCPDETWVLIEGGTFTMGNNDGENSEYPEHVVKISDFELMRTEVLACHYRQCVLDGVCPDQYNCGQIDAKKDEYPVYCIDYETAAVFCEWAGGRLPSESEWEYAARSRGKDIPYPWGDAAPDCERAVIAVVDGDGCGTEDRWPACSKPAGNSEQGLCDMIGNVKERVADNYHGSYNGAPNDGTAWNHNGVGAVFRGAAYYSSIPKTLLATYRTPTATNSATGFRCARSVQGPTDISDPPENPSPPMTGCSGGLLDEETDLCWQDPPAEETMRWEDAVEYCDQLHLGSADDWRVPTLDEARSLMRGCPSTQLDGACPISNDTSFLDWTIDCYGCDYRAGPGADGCFWDPVLSGSCAQWLWTANLADDDWRPWRVAFDTGNVWVDYPTYGNQVRCVRTERVLSSSHDLHRP